MEETLQILHNILVKTPGVSRVILADKTGLTLANLSRFDFELRDVEALGAISSAVYLATEQQGSNVGFIDMSMIVAEFKEGKIMVASCGSAVLCVITDNDVALGMARMTINDAAKKLEVILDKRTETEIEFDSVETELPAIEEITNEEDIQDEFLTDLEAALKELEQF